MAIGKQLSHRNHVLAFLQTARAHGVKVTGHPSFGGVTSGAHAKNSWHYDGLAGDLNTRAGASAAERSELAPWADLAISLGLAYILDRTGRGVGTAAQHRNHLHVDAGATYNFGNGNLTVPAVPNYPALNKGDHGLAVEVLQRELSLYGFNPGDFDEWFGAKTRAAVIAYQKDRHLTVDGQVWRETWGQLRKP